MLSLLQIRPPQPKFLLFQSLPQTLQPSEFVIFIVKAIENSSPTPSSMPMHRQVIFGLPLIRAQTEIDAGTAVSLADTH
jgi:hypothetical protein